MVKKMTAPSATPAGKTGRKSSGKTAGKSTKAEALQGHPLANSVKESAQQIWLAGMGAFSKAQEEGTKVFEALVKEGLTLQKKTQGLAEEKLGDVTGKVNATMSAMADTVTHKAGQNWDKLEAIFETRTAKAMGKLGVPSAKDVAALNARIDALSAAVAKLSKAAAAKPAPTPVEAAAKSAKAAVKKTVKKVSKVVADATAAVAEAAAEAAPVAKKAPAKRARKTAA